MKRANGEGTISKRSSDGRYIGQITLGFDDSGKAVRKCCSAKTKAECKKKLDKLKKEYAAIQGKPVASQNQSFVDYLLNDWIREKRETERLEESTIQTHFSRIRCYFKSFFGNIDLQKVDSKLIANFYAQLNKTISAETIRKIHAIINNAFKKALRDNFVNVNPADGITLPKVHQKEKKSLNDSEVKQLLETAKEYVNDSKNQNKNMFVLINLALASGFRRGELLALKWDDVDFLKNKIRIDEAVEELKEEVKLKAPKTEASYRTISIPQKMMDMLEEHKKSYATGEFVFPNSKDKDSFLAPSNMCRSYRKIVKMSGLKTSFHELRHTHITNLIINGVDLKTVQKRAGHTRIETTMSYVHPPEEKDIEAASVFDKFL